MWTKNKEHSDSPLGLASTGTWGAPGGSSCGSSPSELASNSSSVSSSLYGMTSSSGPREPWESARRLLILAPQVSGNEEEFQLLNVTLKSFIFVQQLQHKWRVVGLQQVFNPTIWESQTLYQLRMAMSVCLFVHYFCLDWNTSALNWLARNLIQSFMIPRGCILMTFGDS